MPNCKPGDLAVIVRSKYAKENTGKIVRIVRRYEPGERFGNFVPGNTRYVSWIVESCGSPLKAHNHAEGVHGAFMVRPYADSALLPLRPDSLDEETRHVDRTIKA